MSLSEQSILNALYVARGDLFVAASYLNTTPRRLDGMIRLSGYVQASVAAINRIKCDPEYDRLSREQFEDRMNGMMAEYKEAAIDVIYELATMPYDTAQMAEVKLKAAIALRGDPNIGKTDNSQALMLSELNQIYQQTAPRIKSIRVAQVDYE